MSQTKVENNNILLPPLNYCLGNPIPIAYSFHSYPSSPTFSDSSSVHSFTSSSSSSSNNNNKNTNNNAIDTRRDGYIDDDILLIRGNHFPSPLLSLVEKWTLDPHSNNDYNTKSLFSRSSHFDDHSIQVDNNGYQNDYLTYGNTNDDNNNNINGAKMIHLGKFDPQLMDIRFGIYQQQQRQKYMAKKFQYEINLSKRRHSYHHHHHPFLQQQYRHPTYQYFSHIQLLKQASLQNLIKQRQNQNSKVDFNPECELESSTIKNNHSIKIEVVQQAPSYQAELPKLTPTQCNQHHHLEQNPEFPSCQDSLSSPCGNGEGTTILNALKIDIEKIIRHQVLISSSNNNNNHNNNSIDTIQIKNVLIDNSVPFTQVCNHSNFRKTSQENDTNLPSQDEADLLTLSSLIENRFLLDQSPREISKQHSFMRLTNIKSSDIELYEPLGFGNGGVVYKALYLPLNYWMALKTIHMDIYSQSLCQQSILNEMKLLSTCSSPYIVSCLGVYLDGGDIHLCMEWMDQGSLDSVLKKFKDKTRIVNEKSSSTVSTLIMKDQKDTGENGAPTTTTSKLSYSGFPESILVLIIYSILKGLVYLYTHHQIIHRDVKPSNILVHSNGYVKLCDLGVSGKLVQSTAKSYVGTSAYMAPERILGEEYSCQADSWSLGMTILEIVFGQFPLLSEMNAASSMAGSGSGSESVSLSASKISIDQYRINDKENQLQDGSLSLSHVTNTNCHLKGDLGSTTGNCSNNNDNTSLESLPNLPQAPTLSPVSLFEQLTWIVNEPMPRVSDKYYSNEFCDFVGLCLLKDPKIRPSPNELLTHPLLQNLVEDSGGSTFIELRKILKEWLVDLISYHHS